MVAGPIVVQSRGPNIVIRILWFLALGLWLGGIISGLAWILNVTIFGLPLGLWLINRLPSVITLRPQEKEWRLEGNMLIQGKEQRPFLLRALYFIFIGIWFSGVWMGLSYLALVTVIGLPLSFWMYGRIGAVTTLYRS